MQRHHCIRPVFMRVGNRLTKNYTQLPPGVCLLLIQLQQLELILVIAVYDSAVITSFIVTFTSECRCKSTS